MLSPRLVAEGLGASGSELESCGLLGVANCKQLPPAPCLASQARVSLLHLQVRLLCFPSPW